jgi:TrmH family RNA methyltransferase
MVKVLFELNWGKEGLVVLGNEGQGISPQVMNCSTSITIPRIGRAESLNVSVLRCNYYAQILAEI